jgi:DNA repair exonuclease SbcCD ATPase subunit
VKFPELEINQFMAITHAMVSLADRGLVLIQGQNHADTSADSNGVGKSSIAEALEWCWFGETARGISGDTVINRDAKKDTFVKSTVIDGHMSYTATRYRKHKTGKNTFTLKQFDGLKETDLTKGKDALTQIEANKIIGCSLEVFAASIYAGQEKMPDLPAMTDKNLKVIIEEASGASVLEGAYKAASKALNDSEKELMLRRADVSAEQGQLSFIRNQLVQATTHLADWETNKGIREANIRAEIGAVVPHLKRLKEQLEKLDKAKVEADIADCDSKVALVSEEHKGLAALDKVLSDAKVYLGAYQNEISMHTSALTRAEKGLADVEHQVGCPCTSCGRPLTEAELAAAKASKQTDVDAYAKAVKVAEDKTKAQEIAVNDAQSARDDFAATMTDISAVAAQRSAFERELASINELLRQQTIFVNNAKAWRDQLLAVQAETNPHKATIDSLTAQAESVEKKLASAEATVKEQEEDVALNAEVAKLYGPAGVRATILDDVTPFLNSQSAKYLTILSDGNIEATWTTLTPDSKGVLKEKFTIDVTNATGGETYKALSGGEKRKVRIATALALQDLVATRATKPIDLWIGDEIDDALDSSGLERLMQILEEKARERGSVFVISHNELRDHIKQVLLVEKLANKTTKITEMAA